MVREFIVALALISFCLSLPLESQKKELNIEQEFQTQALVALHKSNAPGKFKEFVPLVGQTIVYAGAVLPLVKAKKEHKKTHELTESMLVQTVADAAGAKISDLEKSLPTAEDMLSAMIAVGNVIGGSSGFNPIEMMSNIVGKEQMTAMLDEVMKFPLRFPEPTEDQLVSAEQVVLSIGLGFGDQETAIKSFISSMSKEQSEMITSLQQNVIEKFMSSMMTASGEPSPALVEEIKRQMGEMEKKKGSTEMMPQELKDLVATTSSVKEELVQSQALVAITGDKMNQFKNFIPLVNQVVLYSGVVLPSVQAKKMNKHNNELSQSILIQSLAGPNNSSAQLAELEKVLPTSADVLDAMIAIGRVMGGSSGFNPVQMMTNLLGKEEMQKAVDEVMKFPFKFPDFTEEQLNSAEQVVLSAGLGFSNQQQAIDQFMGILSEDQKTMIASLQKNVIEKLMNSMTLPSGEPSPALIEEIKSQMREMEAKTGSTDMMPDSLIDLVKQSKPAQ